MLSVKYNTEMQCIFTYIGSHSLHGWLLCTVRTGELFHVSQDTVYSPHISFCRRIREAEKKQDIVLDHTLMPENGSLCGYHLSLCCLVQPRNGIVTQCPWHDLTRSGCKPRVRRQCHILCVPMNTLAKHRGHYQDCLPFSSS